MLSCFTTKKPATPSAPQKAAPLATSHVHRTATSVSLIRTPSNSKPNNFEADREQPAVVYADELLAIRKF